MELYPPIEWFEPPKPEQPATLRFFDVLLVLLGLLVVAVVFCLPAYLGFLALFNEPNNADIELASLVNAATIGFTGAFFSTLLVMSLRGYKWQDLGFRTPSLTWGVAAVVLGVVAVPLRLALIFFLVAFTGGDFAMQESTTTSEEPHPILLLAALQAFILIVILAPLTEELLFRAILYGWARRLGRVLGVIISGVAFGLAHIEPIVVVSNTVLGLILASSYEGSRSIWIPMTIHFVNNAIVVLMVVAIVFLAVLGSL
jgi:membrane protease YdiL (CAAX protease family)